jgi:hypothetical protein
MTSVQGWAWFKRTLETEGGRRVERVQTRKEFECYSKCSKSHRRHTSRGTL